MGATSWYNWSAEGGVYADAGAADVVAGAGAVDAALGAAAGACSGC